LDRLRAAGIEVHVRSAFLQGLLLISPEDRPAKFARWREPLAAWDGWLMESLLTPLTGALGFACGDGRIDRVVVGVDSHRQLTEIVAASRLTIPTVPRFLSEEAPLLINPANWQYL
jgi:aryl-alcohol dehydrogenase-like predicted oxidoreductase